MNESAMPWVLLSPLDQAMLLVTGFLVGIFCGGALILLGYAARSFWERTAARRQVREALDRASVTTTRTVTDADGSSRSVNVRTERRTR